MRVPSGCCRSSKEQPGAPKGQKSACFKISMHIVLQNNHCLVKGTSNDRYGQHSMNLVKQFVAAIYKDMGDVKGVDMSIDSMEWAFRVMGAAKMVFTEKLEQSVPPKELIFSGRRESMKAQNGVNVFCTGSWPAEIGIKAQEDLLYKGWCEHTASVNVAGDACSGFTNLCVIQWQLSDGAGKMPTKSVK